MLTLGLAFHQPLFLIELNYGSGIGLFVAHAVICVAIGAVGLILQIKKYPSLLDKKPDSDIAKLFRFLLGNRVAASDLTRHQLDLYRISESVSSHPAHQD